MIEAGLADIEAWRDALRVRLVVLLRLRLTFCL